MTRRRVLLLAYYFPPIGGGGVQRALKLVRHLPDLGYLPTVLTGSGMGFGHWSPEDASMVAEIPDGVEVLRVPGSEPGPPGRLLRRIERVGCLRPAAERWWIDGAVATGRRVDDVDLVVGELVPYATADAAAALARSLGVPWVADLQDPWALDEMWQYPTGLHRLHDLRRMRRLLGSASAIVMNTPEAEARLERSLPTLRDKLIVSIPNGFDAADFAGEPSPRADGRFRIVHAGYLHTEFGVEHRRRGWLRRLLGGLPVPEVDYLTRSHFYLLQAVNRLLGEDPALASQLEVHLAGVLTKTDEEVAASCPVVRRHGYLAHGATLELVRTAELLFLPMHDLPPGLRAGLVPGKTYEYLASGRPILAAVPDGDARDLLAEAGTAFVCRPADVDAMADAIRAEVARWRDGRRPQPPRAEVVARYERRRQAEQFAEVIGRVLGDVAAPRVATANRPRSDRAVSF